MDFLNKLKSLPILKKRILGLAVIVLMVVSLPFFTRAVITQNFNPFKKAASGEPVPTPVAVPINWASGSISITADDFYVISNGKRYDANTGNITVSPGPSGSTVESIEVASDAYGDGLKLQAMFQKDGNNYSWWANHINLSGNLIPPSSFDGVFFKSVIGQSYQENGNQVFIVRGHTDGQQIAEVHFTNLHIQAFVGQTPPPTSCPPQPLLIQIPGGEGQTGINQKHRFYFDVYRNDPSCMGNLVVNLSARVPDGWIASFEHPSFSLAKNANFYTTLDITPTTYNPVDEPIIIYANTVYPTSAASKQIHLTVSQTPQPLPTPPYSNYCPMTCSGNYDCGYDLNCVQGYCRNPSCTSSTSCICGTYPAPTATAMPTAPPGCRYIQTVCTDSYPSHCSYTLDCSPTHTPSPPYTAPGCTRAGCNGEICVSAYDDTRMGNSICLARPEYACYNSARCEQQSNGQCGWTQTPQLRACLNNPTSPPSWCATNGSYCQFQYCSPKDPNRACYTTGGICQNNVCGPAGECQTCADKNNTQCASGLICQNPQTDNSFVYRPGVCVKPDGSSQCNQPTSRSFEIFFKFDGVNDGSASNAKVNTTFVSSALNNTLGFETTPIAITYIGNGVYTLTFTVPSAALPAANDYAITLKGEKHLHVKFCTNNQTTHCSINTPGSISIPANQTTAMSFNFIGMPLPAGDTWQQNGQDGFVDANDFNAILGLTKKLSTTLTPNDILMGDLNYDGRIDTRDLFLIRKTLETRYD